MQLSKLTFSLASLVVLLVFVAGSAMAHVVPSEDDPKVGILNHTTAEAAHPVVKSMTLKGDAADKYVGIDTFLVDIAFEAVNQPNKITAPIATEIVGLTYTVNNLEIVEMLRKSATLYEARLRSTSNGAGVTTISVTPGNNLIFTPADPEVGDIPDATMNSAKATVTVDRTMPIFTAGAASVAPMQGESGPLNNEWATAFDVIFEITDAGGALDGTTLDLKADPDTVTFSNKRWLGGNRYAATVTPKTVTTTETAATVVTITATIKDKSGNSASDSVMATLAKRTADGGSPPPVTTPPMATITVSNHVAAAGTFDIAVTFTPATDVAGVTIPEGVAWLTVTDAGMNAVIVTEAAGTEDNPVTDPLRVANSYEATLSYNARHALPLTITITQTVQETSNPTHSDTVGTATLIPPVPTVAKAMATFSGTLSLTEQSIITVTFDKAVTGLTADDFDVMGGDVTSLRVKPDLAPAMADTVWEIVIDPDDDPFTESITVTIDVASTHAEPATTNGSLTMVVPEETLNSITAADSANDTAAFIVSFTFAAALPDGVSLTANDIKVTPTTATVGTPVASPADAKIWQVLITPTADADTTIGLSDKGMVQFSYAGDPEEVATKEDDPTVGDVTAAYVAATMTTTLTGTIGANSPTDSTSGFAVVGHADLPDLEEFFDIGGTIGLHDADSADGDDDNSREVIISEILWGLDFGATAIADQKQWQFIELYNTTSAPIVLDGWTLKFTEGRPVPKKDVDQVSNRAGAGWIVDIGQSGRVTGTTAADATNLITPINVISMYRNINYAQVEKVKVDGTADPDRAGQLGGTKDGNARGEWEVSVRRDSNTPAGAGISGDQAARWIYASRGRQPYTTTAILTASPVARSPFIINEVGNGSGDTNDWVEIRNVTSSEASLNNHHLSYVSGFDTDTSLVNFKDKDIKVPGNGVILLVNTDPKNTGIAAGRNAAVAEADQELTGATSRYYINSNLKLPDDGKFNLILRNAHDKLKASSHFMDVIGGLVVTDNTKGTSLWPLVATGGPDGDVVEANGRDLKSGYVYIRKNAGGGTGEHHLGRAGYTGVGYDRAALKSDANGGTPGYENGAVKGKIAELSAAAITFSEIMVDTGEGRQNLAQWIELYNSSMTQAVSLGGWKLAIENASSDVETALNATLSLDGMTISPNQTVLIVSTSGRVSDPDHFPSTRVVNLWTTKKHRDELEMVRRTDQVFSATGFHFKLTDADNKLVDEAGNLDGNRRTRDEIAWEIPTGEDDDRRSSLIRVYDEGVAVKGTSAAGWISADETNLAFAISETYYGDPDDFGTPGFRGGGPLPVSLSKFRPELLDSGEIVVRWITESELNNAGFNILRSETRNGEFTKLNTKLIAGQGTTSERTVYSFPDTTAKPNVAYYYQIQDVSIDGRVQTLRQSRIKGYVSPSGKLTTTWGDLKLQD